MTTWVGSVAVWFFESNQIENDFFFYLVTFFFFCLEALHLWLNLVLLLLAKVWPAANFRSPFGFPSSETVKRNWNFFIGRQTDIETVNIIFDKETNRHRNVYIILIRRQKDTKSVYIGRQTDSKSVYISWTEVRQFVIINRIYKIIFSCTTDFLGKYDAKYSIYLSEYWQAH